MIPRGVLSAPASEYAPIPEKRYGLFREICGTLDMVSVGKSGKSGDIDGGAGHPRRRTRVASDNAGTMGPGFNKVLSPIFRLTLCSKPISAARIQLAALKTNFCRVALKANFMQV